MGFNELQAFLERGGDVLFMIMIATFFMWALILDRMFYFYLGHRSAAEEAVEEWQDAKRTLSGIEDRARRRTYGRWIRERIISEVRGEAEANVTMTKALVALAPLLGLLGTVTGMVSVFDVMAGTGGADPKAMSDGVQRATIPTMAGMVASLSGIWFISGVNTKVNRLTQGVADDLTMEDL